MSTEPTLKRGLSLPLITFYGLGTILGAGIYVLVGEVAGRAGMAAPFAFLIAALLAGFSALSYAELSARFPVSASEAVYLMHAFGRPNLSRLVGLMLVSVGIVSAATMIHGFVGYLGVFVDLPRVPVVVALVVGLGALAAWGITESALFATVGTLIEVGGLLLVLWGGRGHLAELPLQWRAMLPGLDPAQWAGIFGGAFLAFYAYVGFEDIVNVAEEVREPRRNLPRAVVLALLVSTLLYMAVTTVSVLTIAPAQLAASEAPLALVYQHSTGLSPQLISAIGMAAVINGALIQVILATRVLYGLARQGWLPLWFGRVHPLTRTPLHTTLLVSAAILALALSLQLVTLAEITTFITLAVFALVNLALLRLKHTTPCPAGHFSVPRWVPWCGFLTCVAFLLLRLIGLD